MPRAPGPGVASAVRPGNCNGLLFPLPFFRPGNRAPEPLLVTRLRLNSRWGGDRDGTRPSTLPPRPPRSCSA